MSEPGDGVERLRVVARRLVFGAGVCSALPILAFLGSRLYEGLATPATGHLPRRLALMLVLYLVPVGLVLLVLGLAAALLAWWLGRERASAGRGSS